MTILSVPYNGALEKRAKETERERESFWQNFGISSALRDNKTWLFPLINFLNTIVNLEMIWFKCDERVEILKEGIQ